MEMQNASSPNPTHETGFAVHRALMPAWLFVEAVKGSKQVWVPENEETDNGDQVEVTIEASESSPSSIMEETLDNLQSATYMGNTVLHILASFGHTELVSLLCQKDGSLWRAQNKMLETPFHCAAKSGHEDAISALIYFALNYGQDRLKMVLRARNERGETAMHEAAKRGHEGVIFKLMEVDLLLALQPNNNGRSPLDLAAFWSGSCPDGADMIKKMLEQLSKEKIDSAQSHTTLKSIYNGIQSDFEISNTMHIHFLASAGRVRVVKLLLEKNKSLAYLQDSDGSFPVHLAALMGKPKTVALFMKMCPDSGELLDNRGRNFFHVAADRNKSQVFTNLMNKSHKNPLNNMKEMFIKMILETDNDGNTPLHLAILKEHKSVTETISATLKESESPESFIQNMNGLALPDISPIRKSPRVRSEPAKISSNLPNKLQLIGLGAVLITTIAFAVAFTPPGGYNSRGSPLLAQKYIFKAFMLADTIAFVFSALCVALITYSGLIFTNSTDDEIITGPVFLFSTALKCMILAFGLGLYLILEPVIKGFSILILVMIIVSIWAEMSLQVSSALKDIRDGTSSQPNWDVATILSYPFVILFIFLFALLH